MPEPTTAAAAAPPAKSWFAKNGALMAASVFVIGFLYIACVIVTKKHETALTPEQLLHVATSTTPAKKRSHSDTKALTKLSAEIVGVDEHTATPSTNIDVTLKDGSIVHIVRTP